ncbi:MAG: Crp/Fnr family transcriptional regulator [Treponema sp.]|jgi:CRP-like cAMP-binding protein|nr:Crp/Fnr family transcriptional regulator [Treponema sp.]
MSDMFNLNIITFKKGSYIIIESKEDDRFFILKEGKVQLSREDEVVKERDGNILQAGDFFGVVAAMSHHNHIETAQALTDVSLIAVQEDEFDGFIQHNTEVAMNIIVQFSNRMRYLSKAFTQLTLNDTTEEDEVAHLFDIGKYYDKTENFSHAFYAYQQYLKYCPNGEHAAEAKERYKAVLSYAKSIPFTSDGNKRIYAADTVLYAQGEPAQEMYVIQSGAVKITKIVNNNEVLLAVFKAGDILGEMAILESKPRSVTAVTVEATTLISISKNNFANIVSTNPQIVGRLVKSLADRIWFMYRQLTNTSLMDPIARMYDVLLIQLEKNRIPLESPNAYSFDIGPQELVSLAAVPEEDVDKALNKFTANPIIKIIEGKIYVEHIKSLTKECNYYKSVDRRKKAFRESQDKDKRIEIPKISKPDTIEIPKVPKPGSSEQ